MPRQKPHKDARMNETQLRELAIAALDKTLNARTGRIRAENITRSTEDAALVPDCETADITFDQDRGEFASVEEEVSNNGKHRAVSENRIFSAEDTEPILYGRIFETGPEEGEAGTEPDEETQVDGPTDPDAARWSVVRPEQIGRTAGEFVQVPDYTWLKTLLSDSTVKIEDLGGEGGQRVLTLAPNMEQMRALPGLEAMPTKSEGTFSIRLNLDGGELVNWSWESPEVEGFVNQLRISYWRIGKPVSIERPTPEDCLPPLPPVHTTIARCDLLEVDRFLTFELDGSPRVAQSIWDKRGGEDYVPLAAGDQVQIWGSTRRSRTDKVQKSTTFNLWAAYMSDERAIGVSQPFYDVNNQSPRERRYYQRTLDVSDRTVTIDAVRIDSERIEIAFNDEIGIEGDEFRLAYILVDWTALAVGTPVVVQAVQLGRDSLIGRLELADGTLAYDMRQAAAKIPG